MGKKRLIDFDIEVFQRIEDEQEYSSIPTTARELRRHIERGATVEDIAYYKHETLRTTLSFFRVVDRSKATTKEEMAILLINAFRGGKNAYGDKSRKIKKKKQKDERDNKFVEIQNEVIRAIKRRGGI